MQHSCLPSILQASLNLNNGKRNKKRKDGAEKDRERKKKKLKEIVAKCMNIQEAFARASTSTETHTTVDSTLLLEHQD